MTAKARRFDSFEQAFALCFAEEISGETYFATMSEAETDPRNAAILRKLALIETENIRALRPLAISLGLAPQDEAAIRQEGRESANNRKTLPFAEFMAHILSDYPAFVAEFDQLDELSPPEAKAAAKLLYDHEVAMIDMALTFLTGTGDPHAPLDAYLDQIGKAAPA